MKALMYLGPRNMPIVDVEEPVPKENEVKIKVLYCGICGSDIHGYTGQTGRKIPPMIMGHEFSGRIVSFGRNVNKFRVGQRVSVQPINFCGRCPMCLHGDVQICRNRRGLGVMDVNGAFTDYICVDEKMVYPLPDTVGDMQGALIEPLSVTYHAVKKLLPLEGKTVLVAGTGVIGILTIQWLQAFHAARIIAVGRNDAKLEMAEKMGADIAVNTLQRPLADALHEAGLADGVDIAIECVGATATVQQTISSVRPKGTVLWLGNSAKIVETDMQKIVTSEIVVMGSYGFTSDEFGEVIQLVAEGRIHADALITRVVPFQEAPKTFDELADGASGDFKVLVKVTD